MTDNAFTQAGSADFTHKAVVFECDEERLVGVLTHPVRGETSELGVLVVVGGPQTRCGSHRQFTSLARELAACGFPTLRFDVRGMGDATGSQRSFLQIDADIAAALQAFQQQWPTLRRVVLWGLCDGASASLLYLQATQDARIAGLVLLNPWVRSAETLAQTHVKHYYWQRLRQPSFWKKLLTGGVAGRALRELASNIKAARGSSSQGAQTPAPLSFQARMLQGASEFKGPSLWVLSGQDYTAKEFSGLVATDPRWKAVLDRADSCTLALPGADHTFSSAPDEAAVSRRTAAWLARLGTAASGATS